MIKGQRCLVTGGAGTIGSTIVDQLVAAEAAEVIVLDFLDKGGLVAAGQFQFDQPDVFLVHQWEGELITREHGGPVRMLVPRLYLWKSAKWLRRIHFTISDHPGFWEIRGYHNNADPWLEERYS